MSKITTIQYPVPPSDESVSDNYFGTPVKDPYRPLEDGNSPVLRQWVKDENTLTEQYLSGIPYRNDLKKRLAELYDYPKYGIPEKHGDYYYFFKNTGLQNQSVLYRQRGLDGTPDIFLDPNSFSTEGTTALSNISFSKEGEFMAYALSEAGSDWSEISIIETSTGKHTGDKIKWVKFSVAKWCGEGFYYSGYGAPAKGAEFSETTVSQKVFFHRLGTNQAEDTLVFEDTVHPLRYYHVEVSDDSEYVFINSSEGTSGSELLYKKTTSKEGFITLFRGFAHEYEIVDCRKGRLLVYTNAGADNYKLIGKDLNDPQAVSEEVIPEKEDTLQKVTVAGNYLFASYLHHASSKIYQLGLNGKQVREVQLAGTGTAEGFEGAKDEKTVFYSFTSFNHPVSIFAFDAESGISRMFFESKRTFDPEDYTVEQVFYKSKDGTTVPLFLTYKKGLNLKDKNPLLLYGYGGFNISLTPTFNPANILFVERGGIYAVANIRGGGEYGEKWHRGGMLENKQNVFDDLISAAEFLISENYTSPEKLAVTGGSNGGLLVGACMTQRPELFAASVPRVGVLDMLRYHKFTVGWGWVVEYGSSDDEEQFNYLIKYSPVHNIKHGVCYPPTLVMTADHDDRVVPAHSLKFAAGLQEAQECDNPVLLRVDFSAGHGTGKPVSKIIEEAADMMAFIMWNTKTKIK